MEQHGKTLAAWAAALQWRDLPQSVREQALDHLVDTVGVMYSGIEADSCAGARRATTAWGSAGEATVIGVPSLLPAPSAAFLNALHARIHTYDDTYEPGTLHTGSPVIAAALALSEKHGGDGKTFLAAVVAGYEVATRVAASVSPAHYASGFHNTGTCTVFGAAAAASRVIGLDAPAVAEAFGLAGATAGGLRQHQIDGSMFDSAFHGARAAQSGVMVAQLRAEGVQGPPGILEGPMGFCAVMARECDVSRLTQGLGSVFEFSKTTIKPYPTCRFVHGPTEAALTLKHTHQIDPERIRSITIATFRQSMDVSDRPVIKSPFDAVVSHQYAAALALVKGKVELSAITAGANGDPQVLELMQRIRVVHDTNLEKDFPRCWPHRVTIEMMDGKTYSTLSEYPPGRATPIPSATVDRKFLEQSARYLGDDGALRALERLRSCVDVRDMREVTEVTHAALKTDANRATQSRMSTRSRGGNELIHRVLIMAGVLFVWGSAVPSYAQAYPAKPVRLVMPYPAGGSTDTVGRLVAERLTARLGQPVLTDNRPGASAQIGTEAVAKASPDGYTLLMATSTNAINHALNPALPYDFSRDFEPITLIAKAAQLLVVHPSVPARSVREFISFAKSRPGQLSYSSSGTGTSGHLAMEAFAREAKIMMVHVPYKGNAPALNDLVGGQVGAGFVNVVSVIPQIKAKRLTALGVSRSQRSVLAPEIPTIAELGFPGFDVTAWFGVMAPAGTPAAIVARLNKEIVDVLNTKQIQERLLSFGADKSRIESAKDFGEFLQADIQRWTKLVKEIGLKSQ